MSEEIEIRPLAKNPLEEKYITKKNQKWEHQLNMRQLIYTIETCLAMTTGDDKKWGLRYKMPMSQVIQNSARVPAFVEQIKNLAKKVNKTEEVILNSNFFKTIKKDHILQNGIKLFP